MRGESRLLTFWIDDRDMPSKRMFSAALSASCSTPFHMGDAYTTSTPGPPSLDVAELAREPVATLGLVSPAALQGFSPALFLALTSALSEASPPIRGIPTYETVNRLNEQGLAADYTEMISDFARSGILERERLRGGRAAYLLALPNPCRGVEHTRLRAL